MHPGKLRGTLFTRPRVHGNSQGGVGRDNQCFCISNRKHVISIYSGKCISDPALIYRILREMHFMPDNNLEKKIAFHLNCPTKKICLQKLHFKFLELKNCIWGTRFQVPESLPALYSRPSATFPLFLCRFRENFGIPGSQRQGSKPFGNLEPGSPNAIF